MPALSDEKQLYRQRALARRKAFHAENADVAVSVEAVWDELAHTLQLDRCVIGAYVAAGSEIETAGLMRKLAGQGHSLALPVTEPHGHSMLFRSYAPGDKLVKGGFGMMEPEGTQAPLAPDVVVVPLVGFDAVGSRLGRGGGHYDRMLSSLRSRQSIFAVGLAYEVQFFEALPCEAHDEKLNAVITETCVRVF